MPQRRKTFTEQSDGTIKRTFLTDLLLTRQMVDVFAFSTANTPGDYGPSE